MKNVQAQDHLDVCAADGTSTSLTFHVVCAGLTKTLVATCHKRDRATRYIAVVHVAVWCGDGLDDGVCAAWRQRHVVLHQTRCRVRVCGPITELAAVGAYPVTH